MYYYIRYIGEMGWMGRKKKIGNESYVPDTRYHNDIVMTFFYEVLCFFKDIRLVSRKANNDRITITIKNENSGSQIQEPIYYVRLEEEGVLDTLISIFFRFYNECPQAKNISISSSKTHDTESELRVYQKNSNIKGINGFKIENFRSDDKRKIQKIEEELDRTFISVHLSDHLKGLFHKLYDLYKYSEEYQLWNRYYISEFLTSYYSILTCFLCEDELLEAEGVVEKILIPTLNLGVHEIDNKSVKESCQESNYKAGMTMPVVLHAMSLIYNKLEKFLLLEIGEEEILENLLYNEIFLAKLHQMFRFYLIQERNGELCLCHAALPAFRNTLDCSVMGVQVRAMSTYNSYQGIRELRLADKILYEFRQKADMDKEQNTKNCGLIYRITIFGDIVKAGMDDLLQYISKQIRFKEEYRDLSDMRLEFHVYTRRLGDQEDFKWSNAIDSRFHCDFIQYENQLLNKIELKDILGKGDLFFFLDHQDLYRTEVEGVDDLITFKQYISFGGYQGYKSDDLLEDLVLEGKFVDLYHTLTMYAWKNKIGFLKKTAKEDLVKFIRGEVVAQEGKSAYIYISDISAFKGLSCVQENIVRMEAYNQKEIGIIRFTNYSREELPVFFCPPGEECSKRKRLLVINMWQIVKHTVLNQKSNFETLFLNQKEKHMLDEIYIGLDYSDWREMILVSYWFKDKKAFCRETIGEFIQAVIQKIFVNRTKDMYQKYLKKILISILYGAAKSVEDLLFVHILKDKEDLMGKFLWQSSECRDAYSPLDINEMKFNLTLEHYYNYNCKYSLKKYYWEVMDKFDSSGLSILDEYLVFETLKKSSQAKGMAEQNGVVIRFLEEILDVCEAEGYQESALYKNCMKKKQKIS